VDRLVVITGLSGSGKTLAADCLEDAGYFCVDNLPVGLIPPFCELIQRGGERIRRAALVIDAREGGFLEQFPDILAGMRAQAVPVHVVFLDCSDEALKRRFSETRRPHPMAGLEGTLEQAIRREREALAPLREVSDRIVDTTNFTAHELRRFLRNAFGPAQRDDVPRINLLSFGFKHGVPDEADLVFDVRFLPNPHFVAHLRELDGRDPRIQDFLDQSELTAQFQQRLIDFLQFLIPNYAAEGKAYLTVAIGCTGGKHRSVALAEWLGRHYQGVNIPASVHHRDVGRE
jgi:UPF0042 nucleotide-binding protein